MRYFKIAILILVTATISSVAALKLVEHRLAENTLEERTTVLPTQLVNHQTMYGAPGRIQPVDFTFSAEKSTPTVVHVKTLSEVGSDHQDDWMRWFYGDDYSPRRATSSGSGVIVSQDGYVVTNNHVIDNASDIEVILYDNRSFSAKLIGRDLDTDLALLQIDAPNLTAIRFGNSDSVRIGEWVLAVGNPFNLSSTVTAGIVSAKTRNIDILENTRGGSNTAIESFIQTDAAVNPGNSGGALVNIQGELIGINTAIATPTGTFAGYSFAVPANLVEKVMIDLRDFGVVQRGFLGVNIRDINQELADQLDLSKVEGVYLANIIEGGAADAAGLEIGDVITSINGVSVPNAPALQEQVAGYRPGDILQVAFIRDGRSQFKNVKLRNKFNSTDMIDERDG